MRAAARCRAQQDPDYQATTHVDRTAQRIGTLHRTRHARTECPLGDAYATPERFGSDVIGLLRR